MPIDTLAAWGTPRSTQSILAPLGALTLVMNMKPLVMLPEDRLAMQSGNPVPGLFVIVSGKCQYLHPNAEEPMLIELLEVAITLAGDNKSKNVREAADEALDDWLHEIVHIPVCYQPDRRGKIL